MITFDFSNQNYKPTQKRRMGVVYDSMGGNPSVRDTSKPSGISWGFQLTLISIGDTARRASNKTRGVAATESCTAWWPTSKP